MTQLEADRNNSDRNVVPSLTRGAVVLLTALTAMAVLAGCASHASTVTSTKPSSSATAEVGGGKKVALDQKLTEALSARPEAGTDAYYAQFTGMALPDASVTDPNKLLNAWGQALLVTLPELIAQSAPGGGDGVTVAKWETQTGKTEQALMDEIGIDYYVDGFMAEVYGPNWKSNAFNVTYANTTLKQLVGDTLALTLASKGSSSQKDINYIPTNAVTSFSGSTLTGTTSGKLLYDGNSHTVDPSEVDLRLDSTLNRWVAFAQH